MRVNMSGDGRKSNSTAIATAARILRKWRRWAAELRDHGWLVMEPGTWEEQEESQEDPPGEGMDGKPVDM